MEETTQQVEDPLSAPKEVMEALTGPCLANQQFMALAPVVIIEEMQAGYQETSGRKDGRPGGIGPLPLERIKSIDTVHVIFPSPAQFYSVNCCRHVSLSFAPATIVLVLFFMIIFH